PARPKHAATQTATNVKVNVFPRRRAPKRRSERWWLEVEICTEQALCLPKSSKLEETNQNEQRWDSQWAIHWSAGKRWDGRCADWLDESNQIFTVESIVTAQSAVVTWFL